MDSILDDLEHNQSLHEVTEIPIDNNSLDSLYAQILGTCNELDSKYHQRCCMDSALKSFMPHGLVGGEVPPKTEV